MLSSQPANVPVLLETSQEPLCQHFQQGFQAEGIPMQAGSAIGNGPKNAREPRPELRWV